MTLVKAFESTNYALKIIGFSNDGYEDEIKTYLAGKSHRIEFLGKKNFEEIVPYLKRCLCTVVPSEWYDNFQMSYWKVLPIKKQLLLLILVRYQNLSRIKRQD